MRWWGYGAADDSVRARPGWLSALSLAFSTVNRLYMVALHGRARRSTVLRGGFRPVQWEPEINLAGARDVLA